MRNGRCSSEAPATTDFFADVKEAAIQPDNAFRRNFFVIATLHVAAVAGIFLLNTFQHKSPKDEVVWLDGGELRKIASAADHASYT